MKQKHYMVLNFIKEVLFQRENGPVAIETDAPLGARPSSGPVDHFTVKVRLAA